MTATAQFRIEVEPARDLVRMTLSGFFDEVALRGFLEERRVTHAQLRCAPNQHLTLADVRGMAIQSQDVVAKWRDVLAAPGYRSRRLGFVVATSLVRTQLQRAIGSRDARCFTDAAEAEAWVLAAGPAAARAA